MSETAAGTARERAQAGSISGAIFAALVGADPFDIRTRSHAVQYLDYFAIALWVVAVLMFLFAAAGPRGRAATEEARLVRAVLTASLAGGLTALALLFTAFGFSVDHDAVTLSITAKESRALDLLCGLPPSIEPRGSIRTDTLNNEFVVFTFQHGASRCGTIRISRGEIAAIREDSSWNGKRSGSGDHLPPGEHRPGAGNT